MRRMALGRAHYQKNGLRWSTLQEEWGLCLREELNESPHLVMPLIEGLMRNRQKNFDKIIQENHKANHRRQG
jgi:hypothetical protein